jgi:ubiquinol-cytochrome c reductase cytochrome c1 subunit
MIIRFRTQVAVSIRYYGMYSRSQRLPKHLCATTHFQSVVRPKNLWRTGRVVSHRAAIMWRAILRPAAGLASASGGLALARRMTGNGAGAARADDDALHSPHITWPHSGMLSSFDAASIRRGYHVYTNVCASCHSLNRIAYRNLVGVAFTDDEMKAIVEDLEVEDGPNEEGLNFSRPARLSDYFPSPYPNEEAARYANNGALPPDLSLIIKARHGGENYLWSLLTGYREAPQGISVREGLHYNPYFPGGQIAMAQALYDGAVEYEDGTPATASQMAKDVSVFLAWASEPEHDERKKMGMQWIGALAILSFGMLYMKRFRWSLLKTRRLEFR